MTPDFAIRITCNDCLNGGSQKITWIEIEEILNTTDLINDTDIATLEPQKNTFIEYLYSNNDVADSYREYIFAKNFLVSPLSTLQSTLSMGSISKLIVSNLFICIGRLILKDFKFKVPLAKLL